MGDKGYNIDQPDTEGKVVECWSGRNDGYKVSGVFDQLSGLN